MYLRPSHRTLPLTIFNIFFIFLLLRASLCTVYPSLSSSLLFLFAECIVLLNSAIAFSTLINVVLSAEHSVGSFHIREIALQFQTSGGLAFVFLNSSHTCCAVRVSLHSACRSVGPSCTFFVLLLVHVILMPHRPR